MMTPSDLIVIHGDCQTELAKIAENTVDLIFTSPPYADQRQAAYGGISPFEYVEWFLPISEQLLRILKPEGSFVLNIKEKVENGERSTYVLELILAMKQQGWLWTEEYVWHKKQAYPGKWPNRFRDAWERLLHFNKTKHFSMYQEAVMEDIGGWQQRRLENLCEADKTRRSSASGSNFGTNMSNWVDKEKVYPTNVLHLSSETTNQKHPAVFPERLVEWFVKLFTKEGDMILDPFVGSGTTLAVAGKMNRRCVGIEVVEEYANLAEQRILQLQPRLAGLAN